jgi:hypothetical protein
MSALTLWDFRPARAAQLLHAEAVGGNVITVTNALLRKLGR